MLLNRFDHLMSISNNGKPFIYTNGRSAFLHFDILAVQSEMDVNAPYRLVLSYTRTMMGFLLFHQAPKSIAMIGLGGGSMPKYCHRYLPEASIVVLEKNEEVIALRDHFLIPEDDDRLSIHCADGVDFVKTAEQQYDVLVVDGFDKAGQPPRLCSQDFYDDCYRLLAQDGIMVVNLIDNDEVNEIYLDRMRRSFDDAVITVPVFESHNRIAFACKGDSLQLSNQVLIGRLRAIAASHPMDLHQVLKGILQQRQLELVTGRSQAVVF